MLETLSFALIASAARALLDFVCNTQIKSAGLTSNNMSQGNSSAEQAMDRVAPAFVGDGNYSGDGGELLQRLWEFASWKMIRNCPGRYVIKHKKQSPFLIDGVPITAIDTAEFVQKALSRTESDTPSIVVHDLESPQCVDRVKVVVFGHEGTGGGVITYCKQEAATGQEQGQVVYVHTLNTASGLRRKLRGLQIDHILKL